MVIWDFWKENEEYVKKSFRNYINELYFSHYSLISYFSNFHLTTKTRTKNKIPTHTHMYFGFHKFYKKIRRQQVI